MKPETHVEWTGQRTVACTSCGNHVTPFRVVHGQTVVFDEANQVGLTVTEAAAHQIAARAEHEAAQPDASKQHAILTCAVQASDRSARHG